MMIMKCILFTVLFLSPALALAQGGGVRVQARGGGDAIRLEAANSVNASLSTQIEMSTSGKAFLETNVYGLKTEIEKLKLVDPAAANFISEQFNAIDKVLIRKLSELDNRQLALSKFFRYSKGEGFSYIAIVDENRVLQLDSYFFDKYNNDMKSYYLTAFLSRSVPIRDREQKMLFTRSVACYLHGDMSADEYKLNVKAVTFDYPVTTGNEKTE